MPAPQLQTKQAADDFQPQNSGQATANSSNATAKNEQMTQNAPQYVTAKVHKIRSGESFWSIASHYKVPGGYQFLAEYNNMTPSSVIHPGDTINIPKLNPAAQNSAPTQANSAPANNAPAEAPAQANNAPANNAPAEAPAPAVANNAPAEAPAQANNAPANEAGELDLPTKCPLEQLLEKHPEITTNQQLISYFYKQCNKNLSKAYDYARSRYSVEIDDLTSNRKAAINLEKPKAVFANRNAVFSYIVSNLGMSNAGACGVLANMQSESNFDTTCVGDKGTSYGLCQWHDDRKKKLIKFCLNNNYDLNSIAGQLEYLASELASTYASVYKAMKNAPNTEKGAYNAAYRWCVDFESPKDEVSKGKQRGEVAKAYFQTYGKVAAKPKTEKPAQQAPAAAAFFAAPMMDESAAEDEAVVADEPEVANETAGNEPAAEPANEVAENKPATSGYIETSDNTVNEIQKAHPNGITVTLYGGTKKDSDGYAGYSNTTNNREFKSLSTGTASYTNTVDTALNMGSAMMANSSKTAKKLTNKVYNTLHDRYKQAKPASAEEEPESLKIKNLSLYYHGSKNALNFPSGDLGSKSVDAFVNDIRGSLRGDVRVQLFACSTASTKGGENNFAKTMAEALGGEARVYGHETPGPATENANARYYDGQGNATSMFDALMPEDWIKSEAVRIWGLDYTPEAYASLTKKLKTYYEGVCGLPGSDWNSSVRKAFETSTPDAPKAYGESASYKFSGMGRAMFSDTEGAAPMLQKGWRNWALTKERSSLAKFGTLAATFEDVNA